ncbi:SDR family NAD(P)-dependent oxidoreductase [Pseudomonas syringae]|uniref:2,3-dihydroxy-2,3-dihydro-p-cumate dehydrogenase n=1 Tax=Pseudomonas syringae TaxID=317 RepID=A0A085V8J8_PSESX|nr:SDR family NAD(P)-dependent oxidoreductase [Pseudomonas syringae]KFE51761.1 3-hydroxy-2-methylbutyryl-CoA dehydrogenase [Pseudomonas syringae]
MDIRNKVAIVAGGASGLGQATAHHLAERGARVVLVDLNEAAVKQTAQACDGLAIACDVADDQASTAAMQQVIQILGRPHVMVNCAGIAPSARIIGKQGAASLTDFEQVIRINLLGTFNWLRLAADAMKDNAPDVEGERGVIINTASIAAYEGQIGQSAYAASKGAVVSLTLPAARELARYGIRVTAIAPGLFGTAMLESVGDDIKERLIADIPFPHRFGKPSEFSSMVLSIIENPMLNGSVVRLDAALRMQAR